MTLQTEGDFADYQFHIQLVALKYSERILAVLPRAQIDEEI